MRVKELEVLVRRYAPVSLFLEGEGSDSIEVSNVESLMDGADLSDVTTLQQINELIKSQVPQSYPKWMRDGRVLNDCLSMSQLGDAVDVHPNRSKLAFQHQLELLRGRIDGWVTFEDVDEIYTLSLRLLKKNSEQSDMNAIFALLNEQDFWAKQFTERQKESLSKFRIKKWGSR